MNLTNEQWKILPLEGEDYFRVRGAQLGHRYKIANVPFPVYDGNERDVDEALEISKLIVAAPKLLQALQDMLIITVGPGRGDISREQRTIRDALKAVSEALPQCSK